MKRPDYLSSGELGRLIPVATKPELRNTCVTSAMLMAVEEFAEALLGALGAPTGKRAKTHVWLEPVFKSSKNDNKDRPDALIIVNNGRREWRALMEAKAKGADLDADQIECYLDIAKVQGVDAVVTISNQFVATPTQSPCDINRQKLKKVALFHWSWSFLQTEAKIQLSKSAVSDPDQAYMLEEYVRYLEHDSSGVSEFEQMGKEWVEACKLYFAKSKLDKKSPMGAAVVSDWDELMRCTALLMSRNLETNVTTVLSAKERKDPNGRSESMQSSFVSSGELKSRLEIPDAASPISVEADLTRRSVTVSMTVDAPRDKKRAPATVTWLLRQLVKTEDGSIMLVAKWPGRTQDTCAELVKVREDVDALVGDRKGQLPRTFEIRAVSDLGGKFTQRRNFVPELVSCVTRFYEAVGQYVVPWQAPPPKPKKPVQVEESSEESTGPEAGEISAQQIAPGAFEASAIFACAKIADASNVT
ncbi:conserved hypothetical protein [Nitrosococcus oceani ATCC 19707]|uniref:Stress response protein n=3 Tax=Nitrosococcus oceani TaxID=1229 RepID=Q3JDL3_NITOC|nr:hypothetical protein [Nitrosococcus oceani]ABA57083.1 conserved hypothetical protein [Nitrosococcus oceani ATCC 19707]GEM19901.1 hypothetical protein NONS58_13000 [Nitrosococcus oceani]